MFPSETPQVCEADAMMKVQTVLDEFLTASGVSLLLFVFLLFVVRKKVTSVFVCVVPSVLFFDSSLSLFSDF